jgi:hypothetical protein
MAYQPYQLTTDINSELAKKQKDLCGENHMPQLPGSLQPAG